MTNKGGYKFKKFWCKRCKKFVRENWYIRHIRSGCKVGFAVDK